MKVSCESLLTTLVRAVDRDRGASTSTEGRGQIGGSADGGTGAGAGGPGPVIMAGIGRHCRRKLKETHRGSV